MTGIYIAPIVEGDGEVTAVPVLLRRIAKACGATSRLRVNTPIRVKSGSMLNNQKYFHKYVSLASAKAAMHANSGWVLILLDCDDECPADLGPELLRRAQAVRGNVNHVVALAFREYESWFIAAIPSLQGHCGLPFGLTAPSNHDAIRDAKGWLSRQMEQDKPYDPIIHQTKFTEIFDLDQARMNRSFDRLYRKITGILGIANRY
jgi:hypothetical protein